MLNTSINFFLSAFRFTRLGWTMVLAAIALGLIAGAIWLAGYRPPLLKKPWLWAVLAVSAFFTWAAIAFVQVPLQTWTGQALTHFWSGATLNRWLLLAAVPQILLSGIVQEASKLATVIGYWKLGRVQLGAKEGLIAGAIAGAGFGVFEAVWVFNSVFASGWTWHTFQAYGVNALMPFWERFFTVGFHIGVSALAGYGLGRRWGWQFYLLAAFVHGAANYSVVLLQKGFLTAWQTEFYIAFIAVAVIAVTLCLRWRTARTAVGSEA